MDYYHLLAYVAALVAIILAVRILYVPLKCAFYGLYYCSLGGLLIWGINVIGGLVGLHLPLNPVAAFAIGYLGIPGILLVYALHRMLA